MKGGMRFREATPGACGCARWPIMLSVSIRIAFLRDYTHVWQAAIAAKGDLRLVCVDKDLGVTGRATAAVADDCSFVRPSNGFLVNQLHGGEGLRLLKFVSFYVVPFKTRANSSHFARRAVEWRSPT